MSPDCSQELGNSNHGRVYVEETINKKPKLVEVWLTNRDQSDAAVQCQLPPSFNKFKGLGYRITVYQSDKEYLYSRISDLLNYNRKWMAQLEVEREKKLLS